jgi:hypothetical protein
MCLLICFCTVPWKMWVLVTFVCQCAVSQFLVKEKRLNCSDRYVHLVVESSWNVMAHGDARGEKWGGNWRMEWVASTLQTTSEHGVSSITTADAHTSAASSRLNWRPPPIYMDSSVSPKDEIWFLRVCLHISNAVYLHCHELGDLK